MNQNTSDRKKLKTLNESKYLMQRTICETNYKHNINYVHVYICELLLHNF